MNYKSFFNASSKHARVIMSVSLMAAFASCSTSQDETDLEATDPVEEGAAEASSEPAAPETVEAPSATTESVPAPMSPPPAANPSSVESPSASPYASSAAGGPRVMYVKSNGVKVHEKPSTSSRVVTQLDKGDHILVSAEGAWARTHDGYYIASASLSEKGIARSKKKGKWSGNGGSSSSSSAPKSAPAPAQGSATPPTETPSEDQPTE